MDFIRKALTPNHISGQLFGPGAYSKLVVVLVHLHGLAALLQLIGRELAHSVRVQGLHHVRFAVEHAHVRIECVLAAKIVGKLHEKSGEIPN